MTVKTLTPAQAKEARALKAKGQPIASIARKLGVHYQTIWRVIDPFDAPTRTPDTRASVDDIKARIAEIPSDTRSLTGRIFGDPLPSRSALALKQKEAR